MNLSQEHFHCQLKKVTEMSQTPLFPKALSYVYDYLQLYLSWHVSMSITSKFSFVIFVITLYLSSVVKIKDDVNECDYFLRNVQIMMLYRLMCVNRFHTVILYSFLLVLLFCSFLVSVFNVTYLTAFSEMLYIKL